MRLSKHFTLDEFTTSQVASRKGIRNRPGETEIEHMRAVCENILEPTRKHFGKPVIISSGFRSPELNREIGGAKRSDHCKGCAADFSIVGVSNYELAKWIESNRNYKQLILEFYTPGKPHSGWVHCSYTGSPFKNEELTAQRRKDQTVYRQGLRKK